MKIFITGFLLLLSTGVSADACDFKLSQVNGLLSMPLPRPPALQAQIQDLRDQAAAACQSGDAARGLILLEQALKLLGV
jgi:hypothetical protein